MKYTTLPNTDIKVSKLCLGTMTWGEQNTEAQGHSQMDFAVDKGINFFDTAEMYPIPANKATSGFTESFIGNWFKKTGKRNEIVLATKIVGPAKNTTHIRTGGYSKTELEDALHKSLNRLQTDYIDLYQLHWPERSTNYFGRRGYVHDPGDQWEDNFMEVLEVLQGLIRQGKIRHIGVSNETPYGLMRFLEISRKYGLPKMITIQNPYSLLNRLFEVGLAEISHRENVGLLPYSPLGFGVLSGKYLGGKRPENGRVTLYPNYSRYIGATASQATQAYFDLAQKHGLSLTQMALSFVSSQEFVCSTIIGATNLDQLAENIDSINVSLSSEVIKDINAIQELVPNPAP
ncbi:NADP(H)-dependent aldo-keto reductase [Imtechella halotolerans]|uniref:Protein tas n=1 Tax=Imtechella halotolerans K1 TaxID=946077 RepID=I0WJY8_9FLAO|nr:NADP(H)-dependent aldo-keto reductase [Imtechella halotolerans]EID76704.1 aldo/keto reductase [Imtechella halotolerans K1]WMQ62728.1 NADP(H)-dependent aldo-keto reductase [Imtechella halotolerans]